MSKSVFLRLELKTMTGQSLARVWCNRNIMTPTEITIRKADVLTVYMAVEFLRKILRTHWYMKISDGTVLQLQQPCSVLV